MVTGDLPPADRLMLDAYAVRAADGVCGGVAHALLNATGCREHADYRC